MKIKEKVLLIEDERTIRGFMQAILTANPSFASKVR